MSDTKATDKPRQLYVVDVSATVVVLAESLEEAERIAERRRADEETWDCYAVELQQLPPLWDLGEVPYSSHGNATIGELIESGHAPKWKG